MKHLLVIPLMLCMCLCFAERQNISYFKFNGDPTTIKDSTAFYRIVSEPEIGSKLYDVREYYINGSSKLATQSITAEALRLEGRCITFFKNGQKRSIASFKNGRPVDSHYEYYPNGLLYL